MHRKDCDSLKGNARAPRRPIVLLAGAALVAACVAQPAGAAALRMWSESVVDSDHIRVADVAEVLQAMPDQAERYGAVVIKPAPAPGQDVPVTLDDLRDALVRAGANPVEFTVRGSVSCRVVRALTLRVADPSVRGAEGSRWWWPGQTNRRADDACVPTDHASAQVNGEITVSNTVSAASPRTLEDLLYEHIGSRFAELGGRVHLQFSVNARQALSLSKPEYDFRIHSDNERRLGQTSLTVDILRDGQVQQRLPIAVKVSLTVPVVVAARPINKNQVIRQQDVKLEDRDFFHLSKLGLTELGLVVGQETRQFVRRGDMIFHNDLKPRPLVRRGEMMTVWSEVGGVRIKSVAKALQTGSHGETVEVRNEASQQTFLVQVTGPQTGEATGLSGQSLAARQKGERQR